MENILTFVTTDQNMEHMKINTVAWIHRSTDERAIEITALRSDQTQLLVDIKTTGSKDDQERLSQLHDKMLNSFGKFSTQITVYTGTSTVEDQLEIDLKTHLVYLITFGFIAQPVQAFAGAQQLLVTNN